MARFLFVFLTLATIIVSVVSAQRSQSTIIRATTPQEDQKPNSDQVPEAIAVSGDFRAVHVFRFKYQTDLLAGINTLVAEREIKNAVILSGIGSVRNYHVHAVSNRTFPSENIYTKVAREPADLVSINGYVLDGRVHAHLTLADEEKAFGGHLEPETNVFTFAIVTLAEFTDEVDLSRFDDKTYR